MKVYFFSRRSDVADFIYIPEDFPRYDAAMHGTGRPWPPDLATWTPMRGIEYCGEGEDGKPLRPSAPLADVTGFGGLSVSERFVEQLGPVLEANGILYPVDLEHRGTVHRYYLYVCANVVDCLNAADSKGIRQHNHPERFGTLTRPAFFDEKIGDNEIFVLPYMEKGDIYVTERFKDRLVGSKLTGIELYMEPFNESKETRWKSPMPREKPVLNSK